MNYFPNSSEWVPIRSMSMIFSSILQGIAGKSEISYGSPVVMRGISLVLMINDYFSFLDDFQIVPIGRVTLQEIY